MDIYEGKVMVSESLMTGIADSIRRKTGTSNYIQTPSMPGMIDGIVTEPTLQEKAITIDGSDDASINIIPDEGYDGLSKVAITVTGGGPMVDGGFVVNFYNAESQLIQTNSAVCGMFIDSPVSYECDGWKDTDELTVELPITSDEAKAVIDLYPIFLGYEEYSVVFADYPMEGVMHSGIGYYADKGAKYYPPGSVWADNVAYENGYYEVICKSNDLPGYEYTPSSYSGVIRNIPTKKCNKVRIKYSTRYYDGYIGDFGTVTVGDVQQHGKCGVDGEYLVFNVSGDTVTIDIGVTDMTEYHLARFMVSEIYFYYENE